MWRVIAEKLIGRFENDEGIANAYRGKSAEAYLEKRKKQKTWHIEQTFISQLLSETPEDSVVLDVPFGTGRFAGMYLEKGMAVYGLDISRDMFLAAREAIGPDYERCNCSIGKADHLPYKNDSFDLIVCCRFLGLISYPMALRVLRELHRVAKSRVILYMLVHRNVWSFSRLFDRILPVLGIVPRYRRFMGGNIVEDNFLRLLDEAGFIFLNKVVINEIDRKAFAAFFIVNKGNTLLAAK